MTIDPRQPHQEDALSSDELALYRLIMDYRAAEGLPAIPLSQALTVTAGRHVADILYNFWEPGRTLDAGTNYHSWSDGPYPADHSQAPTMWDAPERIGTGYLDNGFEIAGVGYRDGAGALAGWQGSSGHDAVILNAGIWSGYAWQAIGIGLANRPDLGGPFGGNVYFVWFGESPDAPPQIAAEPGGGPLQGTDFGDDMRGGAAADRLSSGAGDDLVRGAAGRDRLTTGQGDDTAEGGAGNDRLRLGAGNDVGAGQAGRDRLFGQAGADTLDGGTGNDRLTGGGGEDVFRFVDRFGRDAVSDLGPGDRVEIVGRGAVADAAALAAALSEVAEGVLYDAGQDGRETILFLGVDLEAVSPAVFGLA